MVRQHLSYVSGGPFQYAMAHGLDLPDAYFTAFRADLPPSATCSARAWRRSVSRAPDRRHLLRDHRRHPLGYADGLAFCRDLPRAGVVAIPHQVFCDDQAIGAPYVRWAFCKQPAVLDAGARRLARGLDLMAILVDDASGRGAAGCGRTWSATPSSTSCTLSPAAGIPDRAFQGDHYDVTDKLRGFAVAEGAMRSTRATRARR